MPADERNLTLPANMSNEEFTKRVAERVWELWRREIEREQERQGKRRRK